MTPGALTPRTEAFALAAAWRLDLAREAPRGARGERIGRGTGSSLEFQDRRHYAAGDDVRHLDWRSFARTDQLFVRLYREEILPRVEILLDLSRSMAVEPAKAQLAIDLAALLADAARAESLEVRLVGVGHDVTPLERAHFERAGAAFDATLSLADAAPRAHAHLREGAVRIAISDFLFPHDARGLVRTLGRGAGALALLQVLGESDLEPEEGLALRLTDSEDDTSLDLVLDRAAVLAYHRRLRALTTALAEETRRAGAVFCELSASLPLADLCRDVLAPAQILAPA